MKPRTAALLLAAGAWLQAGSGLDLISFDRGVRPQDDLFQYVNGRWLDATAIPPDRVSYGALVEIADRVDADLRDIIEGLAAAPTRSRAEQQIVDLYASLMDEARLEHLGAAPIEAELGKIDAIASAKDFAAEAGFLSSIAAGGPFAGSVGVDTRNPRMPIVQLFQGGTLLPDRDYYSRADAAFVEIRRRYEAYLTTIFTLTRRGDPAGDARAVVALETALAAAQWPQADSLDRVKTSNGFALADLPARMPGFDWLAWARPQGIDRTPNVVLSQPSFFKAFAALVPATPLATWKAWLAARYITASAPYLSKAFGDARFDFFGRVLTGQQAPRERWRRGVGLVNQFLGDAIGRLYVENRFSASARRRMQAIVDDLTKAYRLTIAGCEWLTPAAKRTAQTKLARLTTKIAFPDRWRTYGRLTIARGDLLGNIQRAQKFESDERMARLREPPDPGWWNVTPQTVNAYYNLDLNEIVVPAAMLQPPLFAADADPAINYGAIGAIVGHELTHAFDQRGRRYDADGTVRDWWRPEDARAFADRERALLAQLAGFEPLPGLHVNGELTLAETVGDLGGLAVAYRAYTLSLDGRPSPTIDGFSGERRLFLSWARIWRTKMREPYLRQWLLATPYAPPAFRANGIASNLSGFYEAFGVMPGDAMYLAPGERVRLW